MGNAASWGARGHERGRAITHSITTAIQDYGLVAIIVLMTLEAMCIPIPAEITMLFAGFLVSEGHVGFAKVVVAGTLGNLIGSLVLWALAWRFGREALERHGRRVGVKSKHIDQADRWFERHGRLAVMIARCVPVVRALISLPAGLARMPVAPFVAYTVIGCLPFVAAFTALGVAVGPHWSKFHEQLQLFNYLALAVIVGAAAAWWFVRSRRHTNVE